MTTQLETLWARVGFKPNLQQRHAILHVEGPLFLTAGPGSGKTRVLLWRALNLIVFHGVPPEDIFLGTFTEKAGASTPARPRGMSRRRHASHRPCLRPVADAARDRPLHLPPHPRRPAVLSPIGCGPGPWPRRRTRPVLLPTRPLGRSPAGRRLRGRRESGDQRVPPRPTDPNRALPVTGPSHNAIAPVQPAQRGVPRP